MDDTLLVSDINTLKVLADELRLKLYDLIRSYSMAGEVCTVKMLAETLGMPPSRLYYHINLMESAGLLKVAETRLVSGIVEKSYLAAARRLIINQESTGTAADLPAGVISGVINAALGDLWDSLKPSEAVEDEKQLDDLDLRISKHSLNLTEYEASELLERLSALTTEYSMLERSGGEGEPRQAYQVLHLIYQPKQ